MDRVNSRLTLLFLPLLLYTVIMYRMIDSAYQEDEVNAGLDKSTRIRIISPENTSLAMRVLTREFEQVDKKRQELIETMKTILTEDTSRDRSNFVSVREGKMVFSDFASGSNDKHVNNLGYIKTPTYIFNCTNIDKIKLKQKIGHGVSKQAFLGEYNSIPVAVKMVTRHQLDVRNCLEDIRNRDVDTPTNRGKCYAFSNMKLMKEILLLEQMNQHTFIQLLGYCVRNEETDSTDLTEHGVIAVYEYGERFIVDNLRFLTWQERLKHSLDLARFLWYLEHSPLGSLRVRDFKEGHFLRVHSDIKMIDLDDVDNIEPSCGIYVISNSSSNSDTVTKYQSCDFGIQCRMALCIGHNAKQNMQNMNKLFFKRLLYPASFPPNLVSNVGQINANLDTLSVTAADLVAELEHCYRLIGKLPPPA